MLFLLLLQRLATKVSSWLYLSWPSLPAADEWICDGFYHSWYVSVFEVTIIWNLALYSLTKLYAEQTESETKVTIDNIFTAAGIAQLCSLILYRLFFLMWPLVSGRFKTSLRESVRGRSEREEDWEAYEEASLLRHNPAALNEKTPISINSLPTYGT